VGFLPFLEAEASAAILIDHGTYFG